eukprot:CAMPEP_0203915618 /NCGR_PEP_ID=MMETSP0359-20131031/56408_1 /ASSEMBLY_ACC=CAM_ASM_000338 /TAXON_ID=268821 /ORGANISM="Scrippsiella Hangoei, Strain SHTV-5" /LENGTH=293 /DNA_ID=CAMNT_0050842165 /DNA_START=69 /DNA_END=950 /DNA_ORIENTATION=+
MSAPALLLDEEALSSDLDGVVYPQPSKRFGGRAAASVLAVVGCCAALALWGRGTSSSRAPAAVGAVVGLQSVAATLAPSEMLTPPPESVALDNYFKEMMWTGGPSGSQEATTGLANACFDYEELFNNLCYRTCKLLTNGSFPLRTSPWTCCQASQIQDCFFTNQIRNLGICSGYDVGGDGKSCPHPPGKCLPNEELFLGECYEKCSILTNGVEPYRTSAVSCCKTHLALSCFSPSNADMDNGYAAGGGAGDGDPNTPAEAHAPLGGGVVAPVPVPVPALPTPMPVAQMAAAAR